MAAKRKKAAARRAPKTVRIGIAALKRVLVMADNDLSYGERVPNHNDATVLSRVKATVRRAEARA